MWYGVMRRDVVWRGVAWCEGGVGVMWPGGAWRGAAREGLAVGEDRNAGLGWRAGTWMCFIG